MTHRNWGLPPASHPSRGVTPTLVCLERHTRARGRDVERDLVMLALGWAAGVASAILFVVEFAK